MNFIAKIKQHLAPVLIKQSASDLIRSGRGRILRLTELLSARRSKEVINPLRGLTPEQAKKLYEEWREGKYANVQLAWSALEDIDDMLGTVMDNRLSAIGQMPQDILIDSDAIGDDTELAALAEEQKQCIAYYMSKVVNLSEAIAFLATSTFRGYAHLEIVDNIRTIEWMPIDQWLVNRPCHRGAWYYNPDASNSFARCFEMDETNLIIRESARPVDLTAMFAIVAKSHAVDGWDSFIDVFGNPSIFFEMPPGTSDERANDYNDMVDAVIGDGRGSYPNGGKFSTIETTAKGGETFQQRADWCNKQIVRRATGGELTVLAESGSGTLAGGAHMDTFLRLASSEGAQISEIINSSVIRRLLNKHFPGQKHLAYWSLGFDEDNTDQEVTRITQLATAGYRVTKDNVSEVTGFEIEESAGLDPRTMYASVATGYRPQIGAMEQLMDMPLEPMPVDPSTVKSNSTVQNVAPVNDPLSADELDAFKSIGKSGKTGDQIKIDTDAAQQALIARLAGEMIIDPQKDVSTPAKPLQNAKSRRYKQRRRK